MGIILSLGKGSKEGIISKESIISSIDSFPPEDVLYIYKYTQEIIQRLDDDARREYNHKLLSGTDSFEYAIENYWCGVTIVELSDTHVAIQKKYIHNDISWPHRIETSGTDNICLHDISIMRIGNIEYEYKGMLQ